jgi:GT2 family glycosyltransferase
MIKNNPLVSIVIPTYNRAAFIGMAIASVFAQSFHDYELIVVDDGSIDNTGDIVRSHGYKVRYIYQENAGASAARNTGITHSKGEWLAFLDSDDEWRADYLARQMEAAAAHPTVCMQTTDCRFVGRHGETRCYFELNGSNAAFGESDYLLVEQPFCFVVTHGPWQVGSTIIRREALLRGGLFDTSFKTSEDFELMARMALQGAFGLIREELVYVYRRQESMDSLTVQSLKKPIEARTTDARVFDKLRSLGTLTQAERKTLSRVASANRRAMGNLFLKSGNRAAARAAYRRAIAIDPSVHSWGKYALSWLPTGLNLWINGRNARGWR